MCPLALPWWGSRPRTPIWWRHLHHAWKILGKQWLTYQSAVTVFLSSSGMVATWPKFARNTYAIICFEALLFLLNFTGGFSSRKIHTADCCFASGSYWYTQVVSLTMSQTRGDLLPSNFLSIWVHQSTPPCFCSSLRLWGNQRAQRFFTPRQSRKMRVRLPDEIFMIYCISAYAIFESLISDSTLVTFSMDTVVAIRPQRLSSSNVLAPDMNCLNHLKTGSGRRLIYKTVC